ncbi:MAG: hypothetical protein JWP32_1973 [Schumannella sp.]|nr:hypothetical protein [Schumannella sp.]
MTDTEHSLDSPLWRVLGSGASWLIFAFSFTVFILGIVGVLQVGGTCADGGPYVIAVHCPENTDIFTIGGIYGGLAGVFIALLVARGFGTRLVVLAWPILFLTLSVPFLLTGLPFLVIGVLFVLMALAPLVIEWRAAGPQRTFLGITNPAGTRFRERDGARAAMMSPGAPNPLDAVQPTTGDWTLSLGLAIGAAVLGTVLGVLVFNAS